MSWVRLLAWSEKSTWAEHSESPSATHSTWAQQEHSHPSHFAVDFWSWSERELDHSHAAEFRSELALMMTTTMSCRLNCLICHLSGFRVLVARLVQVSGVSCVSHDAVRLVTSPPCVSRHTESSVPDHPWPDC